MILSSEAIYLHISTKESGEKMGWSVAGISRDGLYAVTESLVVESAIVASSATGELIKTTVMPEVGILQCERVLQSLLDSAPTIAAELESLDEAISDLSSLIKLAAAAQEKALRCFLVEAVRMRIEIGREFGQQQMLPHDVATLLGQMDAEFNSHTWRFPSVGAQFTCLNRLKVSRGELMQMIASAPTDEVRMTIYQVHLMRSTLRLISGLTY